MTGIYLIINSTTPRKEHEEGHEDFETSSSIRFPRSYRYHLSIDLISQLTLRLVDLFSDYHEAVILHPRYG